MENDAKLLDYVTYDGVPVWMMSRFYLLYHIVGAKLYGYSPAVRDRKVSPGMLKNMLHTAFHNAGFQKKIKEKEIILYAINRKTIVDGKYFNRYVDQLYSVYPDNSLVIEQPLSDWEWPFPRNYQEVYFDTLGRIMSEVTGRLFYQKDYVQVCKMLRYFNYRLKKVCAIGLEQEELKAAASYLAGLTGAMRCQAGWLEKKLTRKTKAVIMIGAGFPYYYFMNRMLKEKHVISIELQHGYLSKNNPMYNYAEHIVHDPRVTYGLPDYFLTYGGYWNRQMNCPVRKIALGNPYHDYCKKTMMKCEESKKKIVIIGSGENIGGCIRLTEYLGTHFPDFNISFRPHPGQLQKVRRMLAKRRLKTELDENPEIYDTLRTAPILIGETSTVLFEAIGMAERILVWSTKYSDVYMPDHPFETFSTCEELKKLLRTQRASDYPNCEFWQKNWEENYRNFAESIHVVKK